MPRHAWLVAATALVVGFFWACKGDPKTEIVVAVSSQLRVPRALRSVRVVARGANGALVCQTRALNGPADLPVVVAVAGADGEGLDVTVAAYAESASALPADPCATTGGPAPKIVRRATTRLVGGESLHLGMALRQSCVGVTCGDGQTCAAGECVAQDMPPERLVENSDSLVYGTTSFCFPISVCFGDVVPAVPVDPNDCTYQLPDEDDHPERLNVEVLHDDFAREVLDLDPVEGFVRVPDTNNRFRLAPGLCKRVQARKIATLFVGSDCPSKDALNPICYPDPTPPDGGPPLEDSLCTSPADVAPAKGAVYALLDHSRSMRDHFGESPVKTALDLALRAPALRTTQVGLRLLPADPSQCAGASNAYATLGGPDAVPFGAAADVRGAIDGILGDPSRVLPFDAPLYIDAAMRDVGAYQALGALGDDKTWARRYVLFVGNRDLSPSCAPSVGTPVQESFVESRDHDLHAAMLLLKAPIDADQRGHDPFIDAISIARAGGGPFGDASFDEDGMRSAVAGLLAEVGACLYDLPKEIDTTVNFDNIKVSYFDLLASARTDLDFDAKCGPGPGGDGWNVDAGRLRVCGPKCDILRFIHHESAIYAMKRGFVPPDIPVKWAPPCGK